MTDRNKFEEMLERLVNEDRSGAEELFHEIVVEKSRDIYEALLSEESEEEVDEATDEEVDESEEDLDEATDEEVDESEEDELEESDDEDLDESDDDDLEEGFFGEGDPTDDMTMDIEMPGADDMGGDDMGMDMGGDDMGMDGGEGDVEDRVADLEDELEALKAEFEALMGDDDSEEGDMDMDMDMGDEEGEEGDEEEGDMDFGGDEEEPEEESMRFEGKKSSTEMMREYADKVAPAKMGDNGANAKSIVAGKNDMGGTTANIAKGGTEAGVEANKGNLKGSALSDQNPKDMNTKNVNVPGAKAATKMTAQPGHGAEKKGKPETAANKGSMLNGAPKRAK